MLLTLLIACPKPRSLEPPVPEGAPVVPAIVAPLYAASAAEPSDPLVAWAMHERRYDETLAGAAAGLAFVHDKHGAVDESAVRWALIRAGWPYGFEQVELQVVDEDKTPTLLLAELAEVEATTPVGLARVRTPKGDVWSMVVGQQPIEAAPFPREAEIGEALELAVDPAGWTRLSQRALAPSGRVHQGPLVFGEPGEWLLELSGTDASGTASQLIQVPLYVGEPTPEDGLFLSVDTARPSEPEARQQALSDLDVLRDLLGAGELQLDPVLAAVAGAEADRRAAGGSAQDRPALSEQVAGSSAELVCTGVTVQGCLDQLFWAIDPRLVLSDPGWERAGVGARWTTQGLLLVVVLAQ